MRRPSAPLASRRLTYDLRDDLQAIWGFGAMCDDVAHLLLSRSSISRGSAASAARGRARQAPSSRS
jgi:hypothetical protein